MLHCALRQDMEGSKGSEKAKAISDGLAYLMLGSVPTRMGRPHTTIGATAFHF